VIPQDGEKPRIEVRATLEPVHLRPRSHQGILNQIISIIPVPHRDMAEARRDGMAARSSSAVMEGVVIAVASPVCLPTRTVKVGPEHRSAQV
jgi:hypothetical protein